MLQLVTYPYPREVWVATSPNEPARLRAPPHRFGDVDRPGYGVLEKVIDGGKVAALRMVAHVDGRSFV